MATTKTWCERKPPKSKFMPGQTVMPGMSAIEPKPKKPREEQEYMEQWALFDCLKRHEKRFPALAWVHAIPNGLYLSPKTKEKSTRQGVRRGIWDMFIPCARNGKHGLYLEMKWDDNTLTAEQEAYQAHLEAEGYATRIAYNWIDAAYYICEYLGISDARIAQELHINRKGSMRYATPDPLAVKRETEPHDAG